MNWTQKESLVKYLEITFTAIGTSSAFSSGNLSQIPFLFCKVTTYTVRTHHQLNSKNHNSLNKFTILLQWIREKRRIEEKASGSEGNLFGSTTTPPYSSSKKSSTLRFLEKMLEPAPFTSLIRYTQSPFTRFSWSLEPIPILHKYAFSETLGNTPEHKNELKRIQQNRTDSNNNTSLQHYNYLCKNKAGARIWY